MNMCAFTESAIKTTLSFVLMSCYVKLEALEVSQQAIGGLPCTSYTVSITTVFLLQIGHFEHILSVLLKCKL